MMACWPNQKKIVQVVYGFNTVLGGQNPMESHSKLVK